MAVRVYHRRYSQTLNWQPPDSAGREPYDDQPGRRSCQSAISPLSARAAVPPENSGSHALAERNAAIMEQVASRVDDEGRLTGAAGWWPVACPSPDGR